MVFFIPFRWGGYIISRSASELRKADSLDLEKVSVHYRAGFGALSPPSVNVEALKALSMLQ